MRKIHQVEFHEARRLLETLPLDEAKNTVDEYSKKFCCDIGRYRRKCHSYKIASRERRSDGIGQVLDRFEYV
jgi:hypothetical protein